MTLRFFVLQAHYTASPLTSRTEARLAAARLAAGPQLSSWLALKTHLPSLLAWDGESVC